MKRISFYLLLLLPIFINAQSHKGLVLDANTNDPLQFASIGIVGKDVGTTSNVDGTYSIHTVNEFDNDTIRFSSIGYQSKNIQVSDFKALSSKDIRLIPQVVALSEIEVNPRIMQSVTLGNDYKSKTLQGSFSKNEKGYEVGVLLRINKNTLLNEFRCNIVKCTYDSLFYRLNVYKVKDKLEFENILQTPICINQKVEEGQSVLTFDISPYNIVVDHDVLITLEYVKDMGEGMLTYPAKFKISKGATSYVRKTSQGNWEKIPVKIGFNLLAEQEK